MPDKTANRAFLSLGSNIDPESNLVAAVRILSEVGVVAEVSSVYESPPFGYADQPPFLNAAVELHTPLEAPELKEALARIESRLGRVRTGNRFGPRTIDIDIMLFNSDIIQVGSRRIPDAEVLDRPFVAIPLAEIAPDYRHPETGETLSRIAARFSPDAYAMHRRHDVRLDIGVT